MFENGGSSGSLMVLEDSGGGGVVEGGGRGRHVRLSSHEEAGVRGVRFGLEKHIGGLSWGD